MRIPALLILAPCLLSAQTKPQEQAPHSPMAAIALEGGLGVILGGRLAGRTGSTGYTLLTGLAGQAVGAALGVALYSAINSSADTPLALTLTFGLPALFGTWVHNLTGN